ncbi:hypothetical protein Trydic_g7377 [Trypoxylus dichotomus]
MHLNCAKVICNTLEQTDPSVVEWPAQSPDPNHIELLWEKLDWEVQKAVSTSEAYLWRKLQEVWIRITPDMLTKLIARMPRLCAAVIKNKGGHIGESQVYI